MPERTPDYIHGTAPDEQRRLTRLNDLLNGASLRELALTSGERVVDFGCGLGQLTRAMARASGVRVIGIERSAEQITEALRQAREAGEEGLLDLRAGEVETPPLAPAEWGAFDLAHARFVLEHVADPAAVVRQMVRAVRPGGRVVLADDDHDVLRLWPEPDGLTVVWRAYMNTYDRAGRDPLVGRKLVQLLHDTGADPVRNDWVFFGSCSGEPNFTAFVENLARVLEGARSAMLAAGEVDARSVDAVLAAVRTFGVRPDAAIWFAMAWAEGVRRE